MQLGRGMVQHTQQLCPNNPANSVWIPVRMQFNFLVAAKNFPCSLENERDGCTKSTTEKSQFTLQTLTWEKLTFKMVCYMSEAQYRVFRIFDLILRLHPPMISLHRIITRGHHGTHVSKVQTLPYLQSSLLVSTSSRLLEEFLSVAPLPGS